MASSVGAPQFDVNQLGSFYVPAPGEPLPKPGDERDEKHSRVGPVLGGAILMAIMLFVLSLLRQDVTTPPFDDLIAPSTSIAFEPDPLLAEQQRLGGFEYQTRPVGDDSPFVASEGPSGFFGLRRGGGAWVPMTSDDGVDWETDLETPITGVPETFGPGATRWGPEPLQYVDGMYWGRFVSRRVAGSSGAMLLLTSEDGITWEGSDDVPVSLDNAPFGETLFRHPDEFEIRGDGVYANNPVTAPRVFAVPDVDPVDWTIADIAAGREGAALLFRNPDNSMFRIAVTSDGERWVTTALEEHGEGAVEIVVVGAKSVLLRAANIEEGPSELIIPLPELDEQQPATFAVQTVEFLPPYVVPVGQLFVGLVAGVSDSGPVWYISNNGVSWDATRPAPTEGLPPGAVPEGLWSGVQTGVLGVFVERDGAGLIFASSPDGARWTLGPTIGDDGTPELIVAAPTRTGLFISVDTGSVGEERIENYMWNVASNHVSPLDIGPDLLVTAAADSPFGLIIAVTSLTDPSAGSQIRLLDQAGTWTTLDAESDLLFVAEIVTTDFPRVIALSVGGVHETDWDYLLRGDAEVDWQFVTQLGSENVGTFGLRDLLIGPRGAAVLLAPIDRPENVTVLVTRDYRDWTEVDIGLDGRQSQLARLVAINRTNVVVGSHNDVPFAAVVPLDVRG